MMPNKTIYDVYPIHVTGGGVAVTRIVEQRISIKQRYGDGYVKKESWHQNEENQPVVTVLASDQQ